MFRKIFILAVILASALTASAEFRWGPTVGVNFSTFHWKQDLAKTSMLTGGQAGVMGEIMIPGIGFGIDLGLRYNLHGAHVDFGEHEVWASDGIKNQNVWLHTIEIPFNLRFKWTRMNGFERTLAPFVFGGPVFSFTVGTNDAPAIEHPAGYVAMQCLNTGRFREDIPGVSVIRCVQSNLIIIPPKIAVDLSTWLIYSEQSLVCRSHTPPSPLFHLHIRHT